MKKHALGLIETRGLVGAIEACDAAAKTAAVRVASVELTDAAILTLKIEGELAAVQAAVDAGARAAERIGELVSEHVIPRPAQELNSVSSPQKYVATYQAEKRSPTRPDVKHEIRPRRAPETAPSPRATNRPKHAPTHEPRVPPPPPDVAKPPPDKPLAIREALPTDEPLSISELEKLPVVKLRRYARALPGLPIKGRQISMANKTQLLEAIKSLRGS